GHGGVGVVADGMGVAVGAELGLAGMELVVHAVLGDRGRAGEDQVDLAVAVVGVLAHGLAGLEDDDGQHIGPAAQVLGGEEMAEQRITLAAPQIGPGFGDDISFAMNHGGSLLYLYLWYLLPA